MDTKWVKIQKGSRICKYFSVPNVIIIFMELEIGSLIICSVSMAFILGGSLSFLNKDKVSIIILMEINEEQ